MRSRWLGRRWYTSTNGNRILRLQELKLGVYPSRGKWKLWISDPEHGTRYSRKAYGTEDEAKLDLFELYWQVKEDPGK